MSQATTWSVPTTGPATPTVMADRMDDSLNALLTGHKASTRPTYAEAGTIWIDDTANPWLVKMYDGTDDVTIGAINISTNTFKPYDGGAPIQAFPSGTSMVFNQATAPTGWTKKADWAASAALIIGNTYGTGGSDNPVSHTTAVGVAAHSAHTHPGPNHRHLGASHVHDMGSHGHSVVIPRAGWGYVDIMSGAGYLQINKYASIDLPTSVSYSDKTLSSGNTNIGNTGLGGAAWSDYGGTGATGSGGPTDHSITQSTYNPRYVQVIAADKD